MKKQLISIADIRSGFLFKDGLGAYDESGIDVIQLKNVSKEGQLNLADVERASLENFDPADCLKQGDVLLKAKTNHPIAVAITGNLIKTVATAHYFVIRIKTDKVSPGFLAWYLNQRAAQMYFQRNAGGTRIQVINKQVLGNLPIVIPNLSTQENIEKTYILSQRECDLLDALKEQKKKLISVQLLSAISS